MGVSLRKLAKALGVGATTIHFHFEGGVGAVSSAVARQALAGVTRPFKPKEEPAAYLAELLLKIMEALHARQLVVHCRRTKRLRPCRRRSFRT